MQLAGKTAQVSLIDPNQLSPTFNVEQQLQAYYGFKSTLDISHYDIDGKSQDVALAVRELQSSGIPQSSWVNNHLVYTHGYGVVAAPTTEVDPKTQNPVFLDGGMPPSQQIPVTRPQIYFGQGFVASSYSIVGQPCRQHAEAGVRPPWRQRLVDVDTHDLSGSRWHSDRLDPAPIPVRDADARPEHRVQLRAQQRLAAAHGAQSASQGRQGRAVADARRRRLPRGGQRSDQVDRRRLHHVGELSELTAGQPAHGRRDDADDQRRVGQPAEQAGQLPAELGEGRRRRLHRSGVAVRVEPERSTRTRCSGPGSRSFPAWSSRSPAFRPPCSPSCAIPRTCSTCSATCSRSTT